MPPKAATPEYPRVYSHPSISDGRNDHSSFYATRFEVVNSPAVKLVAVQDKVDQWMEYLESFVQRDDTFKGSLARNPEVWTKIENNVNRARTAAKKKQQAIDRC